VKQHTSERSDYEAKKAELATYQALPKASREKKRIEVPTPNPDWITNQAFWWCQDGAVFDSFQADMFADVAAIKLKNFDTSAISAFPVFKNPATDPSPGQSLCRLGFPFHTIESVFNESTGTFEMKNFSLPAMSQATESTRECKPSLTLRT
jgi:hypothetical protein